MTAAARPFDWLAAPALQNLFEAFPRDSLRCVGGCVRDALAGLPVKDVDLATSLPPEAVMKRLRKAGISVVPTGLKHGTVTAVIDHTPYEITTLRHDVETFGRHARVTFIDDWRADAARRDLTINAIYCDRDGALYDPFDGEADLRAGHVRFVGDARQRIAEDYLRLLRFFRFQARYGRGEPDPAAIAACRELAPGLERLSAERVHDEILHLLAGPNVPGILALMERLDVLRHANPALTRVDRLVRLVHVEGLAAEAGVGVAPDPVRRLAALLDEEQLEARTRLRLSNKEKSRISKIHRRRPLMAPDHDVVSRRTLIFDLGAETYRDRCLMAWATAPERDAPGWLEQLAEADRWASPDFPVVGRDVLNLGVESGPAVGALLGEVRQWWRDGGFVADRAACLEQLRALVDGSGLRD